MELYDPPFAVIAQHDGGSHRSMNGYAGDTPPPILRKVSRRNQ
jgi:hypothetical protein